MTIGINGNEANVEHRVGVGQYAFELISKLKDYTVTDYQFTVYLETAPRADMPVTDSSWRYAVFGPKKLWTLTGLQKQLVVEKLRGTAPKVFFTPTHYSPIIMPVPSVISIMDLMYERFPQYFKKKDLYQLRYWTKVSAMQAKKIITISEFSKREICELYHVPPEKVVVTLLGYDQERFNDEVISQKSKVKIIGEKYKISGKYLIILGTLQPKKNHVRLIEAFAQLADKSLKLVVVGMIHEGRGGWMNQPIFDKVKELGLEDRVIFTGYVPDEDIPYLLVGSEMYLLPSLYEGFGIPPVEAMATGVPVVVSRMGSLPEICGQAAVYIDDPYEVSSIREGIEKVLGMSRTEREKRVEAGLKWVKRYNWKDTARRTLDVLRGVADGHY